MDKMRQSDNSSVLNFIEQAKLDSLVDDYEDAFVLRMIGYIKRGIFIISVILCVLCVIVGFLYRKNIEIVFESIATCLALICNAFFWVILFSYARGIYRSWAMNKVIAQALLKIAHTNQLCDAVQNKSYENEDDYSVSPPERF